MIKLGILSPENLKFKTRPFSGKIYYTFQDLQKLPEWPEGPLIELIEGELYLVPSPTPLHQDITRNLIVIITEYLKKTPIGKIYNAPVDVKLSNEDVVIPDLLFIPKENDSIIKEKFIEGTPDLIIEILSSNKTRDLIEKFELYQKCKVKEYWIINPQEKTITIFGLLDNGKFNDGTIFKSIDRIKTNVLKGIVCTLEVKMAK